MKKIIMIGSFLMLEKLCFATQDNKHCLAAYEKIFGSDGTLMLNEHQARPLFIQTDLDSEVQMLEKKLVDEDIAQVHKAREFILNFCQPKPKTTLCPPRS